MKRYNSGKNKQELHLLTVGRPPANSPPAAAKVSYLKVNNIRYLNYYFIWLNINGCT